MYKIYIKKLILIFLVVLLPSVLFAQQAANTGGGGGKDDNILKSSLTDLSVVAGAGIGGAILGLSTLSFEDQPKEHLRHILIGASLGIIIGVGLVAWGQATKSQVFYEEASGEQASLFPNTTDKMSWHIKQKLALYQNPFIFSPESPTLQYTFQF